MRKLEKRQVSQVNLPILVDDRGILRRLRRLRDTAVLHGVAVPPLRAAFAAAKENLVFEPGVRSES